MDRVEAEDTAQAGAWSRLLADYEKQVQVYPDYRPGSDTNADADIAVWLWDYIDPHNRLRGLDAAAALTVINDVCVKITGRPCWLEHSDLAAYLETMAP